jgi:hypothetical protein
LSILACITIGKIIDTLWGSSTNNSFINAINQFFSLIFISSFVYLVYLLSTPKNGISIKSDKIRISKLKNIFEWFSNLIEEEEEGEEDSSFYFLKIFIYLLIGMFLIFVYGLFYQKKVEELSLKDVTGVKVFYEQVERQKVVKDYLIVQKVAKWYEDGSNIDGIELQSKGLNRIYIDLTEITGSNKKKIMIADKINDRINL